MQRLRTLLGAVAVAAVCACSVATEAPEPAPTEPPAPRGPGRIEVRAVDDGFGYFVDGQRTRIRCFGYNTITRGLSDEERAERYDREFAQMRAAGANFVLGWDQFHFDEVLLDAAARHGLGVALHFDLPPTRAYADPVMRATALKEIEAWVARYRNHPAIAMWAPGNEVIWALRGQEPAASTFAAFLVEAADLIRQLDPTRPVLYRDAEDAHLAVVLQALRADGRPRPWFVYGANFFTSRLRDAMHREPLASMGQPMLLSEFGMADATPEGLRGVRRPDGYLEMWGIVREFPNRLLGGCAYVWNTRGPEPLDATFGMVDDHGRPVDTTLETLGRLFREDDRSRGAVSALPAR